MHVVLLSKAYPPWIGGIEKHVQQLAEGLSARGIDITVIACSPDRKRRFDRKDNLKVLQVPRFGTFRSLPLSPGAFRALSKTEADIIHVHHPYPLGLLSYLLCGHARPLVITWHSDIVRQKILLRFFQPFQTRCLQRASSVIVTSPPLMENSAFLRGFHDKCISIPLGIDLEEFDSLLKTEKALETREEISHRLPSLLFVGRLVGYKGLDVLLEAMPKVSATLLVVGEGPLLSIYRTRVQELVLEDRVVFLGSVTDEELAGLYAGCSVFVLPSISNNEAFGIVQLEAMAAGRPVVSTNLPTGVPYVNESDVTGFVVPARDSESLAEALNRLLDKPELAERMGRQGRLRVETEFQLSQMIDRTLSVYEQSSS